MHSFQQAFGGKERKVKVKDEAEEKENVELVDLPLEKSVQAVAGPQIGNLAVAPLANSQSVNNLSVDDNDSLAFDSARDIPEEDMTEEQKQRFAERLNRRQER